MVGGNKMNGAGPDSCADHNHGRTFSEWHYWHHGESSIKYQVSSTKYKDLQYSATPPSPSLLVSNIPGRDSGMYNRALHLKLLYSITYYKKITRLRLQSIVPKDHLSRRLFSPTKNCGQSQ